MMMLMLILPGRIAAIAGVFCKVNSGTREQRVVCDKQKVRMIYCVAKINITNIWHRNDRNMKPLKV